METKSEARKIEETQPEVVPGYNRKGVFQKMVAEQKLSACDRKTLSRRFLLMIWHEFRRADERFPEFASAHEGYAVLQEEVEEVWDAIKHNGLEEAMREMIQVGAMALRFLVCMDPQLKKAKKSVDILNAEK